MIHLMTLNRSPFEKIRDGRKVIEARLLDEKRQRVRVGDKIEFSLREDPTQKVTKKVVDLHIAPTFAKLFDDLGATDLGSKDKEDFLGIMRFYTPEDEKKYGVVGIRLGDN